ncbi:hypothetical protein [Anaeromyxobacter sp. PSR-1]|uniref:hypothetical protein n=1 Tax=Anaeromyxobacter sp. PSR-1 TaxID=1300915 RepID=UPI0005E6B30B|nr:hypothetical protein [Anaeromyxobacter sp. PSR-1]GAO01197.1 hypothetical protein PSR1_00049 [Anaeromyxobacter sp. PSR-1]
MVRALHGIVAGLVAIAAAGVVACSGGGGGDGGGDGDGDVVGFAFNPANMEFAAGLASRVVDTFPAVTDLLTPALVELGGGTLRSGEARALQACASGGASLRWTDGSGDGAWSAGDTARIDLTSCRVHAGDGVVLGGSLNLAFSNVVRGPPRTVAATLELALDTNDGQPGTLRGRAAVAATSADGVHHGLVYQASGTSLLTATGSLPYQLGCFDVRDDPDPQLGFTRRVVPLGVIRMDDKIISFDPGSRLLYRAGDVPGDGRVGLLSLAQPLCTDIGVDPGGVRSDNSMVNMTVAGEPGDVRLELYLRGSTQPDHTDACHWDDLLHPSAGGVINGTNVVDVAGLAAFALDLPRQVGAVGLDLVLGVAAGHPVPLCSAGGYTVTITPGPLAAGHVATVAFGGCVTGEAGDPVTLGGSVTFTFTEVTGDPLTDGYSVATRFTTVDIGLLDDVGEARITGALRFARTATPAGVTEQSTAEPGVALAMSEGEGAGATETRLTAFTVRNAWSDAPGYTMASAGDAMTLAATGVPGPLAVSVTGALTGVEPAPPGAGELKVTATDATSVVARMGSGGAITLLLDANGDGTVDATIPTSWDELD